MSGSAPTSRSPPCDGFGVVPGIDKNRLYNSFPECETRARKVTKKIGLTVTTENVGGGRMNAELTACEQSQSP